MLRFPIYAFLCDTVFKAAQQWHTDWDSKVPFYFWPGYDSIRAETPRVSLNVEVLGTDPVHDKPWKVECGISPPYDIVSDNTGEPVVQLELLHLLGQRKNGIAASLPTFAPLNSFSEHLNGVMDGLVPEGKQGVYRVVGNPASIWFSIVLTPPTNEESRTSGFLPGGTHDWLTRFAERTKGLIVDFERPEADAHNTFACANGEQTDFLHCSRTLSSLNDAGPKVGEVLDSWAISHWPSSMHDGDVTCWDLRRRIYTPWLKAVFDSENGDELIADARQLLGQYPAELSYFRKRIERLLSTGLDFEKRFPSLRPFILAKSKYKHWYSLSLDATISPCLSRNSESNLSSLGTAMLFCGKSLDREFLSIIRTWFEQVFAAFRLFEHAKMAGEEAFEEISRATSHEITKALMGLDIRLKQETKDIEPFLQGSPGSERNPEFISWLTSKDLLLIPNATVFRHLLGYVEMWGRSDWEESISAASWKELGERFVLLGANIEAAIECRLMLVRNSDHSLRCMERFDARVGETLATVTVSDSSSTLSQSDRPMWPDCPDTKIGQAAFADLKRLFLAALLNVLKHSPRTSDAVRISVYSETRRIVITITNQCALSASTSERPAAKHVGTEGVLSFLTRRLGGQLTAFADINSQGLAVTRFEIPNQFEYLNQPIIWPNQYSG